MYDNLLVKDCLNPLGIWKLTKREEYVKLVDAMDYIIDSLAWNGERFGNDFKLGWHSVVDRHDEKDPKAHAKAIDEAVDKPFQWSYEENSHFHYVYMTFFDIINELYVKDLPRIRRGELDVKKDNSEEGK